MMAVVAPQPDGAEELALVERPVPRPGPGEVLVKVAAAGVNRPDILQRRGLYPPPPGAPDILGLEIAGASGRGRRRAAEALLGPEGLRPGRGRRLCRILRWRRRHVLARARARCRSPRRRRCRRPCSPFGSICSSAASRRTATGCWSTAAPAGSAPWRSRWAGCSELNVIVTCGSDEKCARAMELGARRRSITGPQDFVEEVASRSTDGAGVDVVLDMVGGDYVPRNLRVPRRGRPPRVDRRSSAAQSAEIPIVDIMRRRLTLTGLDASARLGRVQDDGRRRDRADGLALCRGRAAEAGDRQRLPADRGGGRLTRGWKPASMSARSCWRLRPEPIAPCPIDAP